MEEKINWPLHDVGSRINAYTINITAEINDALRKELISINLPFTVLNGIWLETALFGSYLLQKRICNNFSGHKKDLASKYTRDAFILTVPTCVFGDTYNENTESKEFISKHFDSRMNTYNACSSDTKILFRNIIRDVFNIDDDSRIKFIKNTLFVRIFLKIGNFIMFCSYALQGNLDSFHRKKISYLPQEILNDYAEYATQAFMAIDENEILVMPI